MADAKKNILTYAGLQELEAELEDLKVNKRKEVAQKIKEAREQGDLSENAEYDAAKDEQRDIEARIEDIEKILKNVEVVAESDIDDTKINVGCHIIIHDFEYDEDLEFSIVGSTQTNSLSGKISNESPLGHALIGHEVGDIVEVEMGDTVSKYKVLDIKKISSVADYFIIASGSNPNQVQALVDNVEEQMYKAGYDDPRVEGYNTASWVLLDYNDVIVHVFSQDDRLFYDLERIWRDGKEIDVDSL